MHFYCYCETSDTLDPSGADSFALRRAALRPLLEALGTVELVDALDDALANDCEKRATNGERCYLLAFAEPHRVPVDFPCNTIAVFPWAYPGLPRADMLPDSADCWVTALSQQGAAICHSGFASSVIESELAEKVLVEAVPTTVVDRDSEDPVGIPAQSAVKNVVINVAAPVVDSSDLTISADTLYPAEGVRFPVSIGPGSEDLRQQFIVDMGKVEAGSASLGFHPPEGWGAWSKADNAWVLMPRVLDGKVLLRLSLQAFGRNVGGEIQLHVGDQVLALRATTDIREYEFQLQLATPTNFLRFSQIDHSLEAGSGDTRCPGIGVGSISVQYPDESATPDTSSPASKEIHLNGSVYTAVVDPREVRCNWIDILTAFSYAFREQPHSTLILNMRCPSAADYLQDLFELLCQLHPFGCRVIAVQGELADAEWHSLVAASSFYVSASHAEGDAYSALSFLAAGVPAIAPIHTAFGDIVNEQNSFIVSTSPEPTFWPVDEDQVLNTYWHRPSWESLRDGFVQSEQLVDEAYRAMSQAARESVASYCNKSELIECLSAFLERIDEREQTP